MSRSRESKRAAGGNNSSTRQPCPWCGRHIVKTWTGQELCVKCGFYRVTNHRTTTGIAAQHRAAEQEEP